MFRRIDRYVIREMIPPFLLGAILVITLFQVNEYLSLKGNSGLEKVGDAGIFRLLLLQTPSVLNFTLPISVALASAVAMSRLTREYELLALRSAGVRIVRVILPMSLFGLLIGVGNLLLIDRLIPITSQAAYDIKRQTTMGDALDKLATNISLRVENRLINIGTAEKRTAKRIDFKDVLIVDDRGKLNTVISTCKSATYSDGTWSFPDARSWTFHSSDAKPTFTPGTLLVLKEKVNVQDLFTPPEPDKLSIGDLSKRIAERKRLGQDVRQLEIEYQVKFSVPVMCWIFALVSPVFAILFARQGGFVGVLISLVVVLAYYNVWVVSTQILTKATNITPVTAAWLPNLIFLIAGLIALRSLE